MVGTIPPRGNHGLNVDAEKQTVAFNIKARVDFKSRKRARMGIWQAMEMLNTLVDDSDPDVSATFEDFVIHAYMHCRPIYLKLTIFFKQRRQSDVMVSPNGCRSLALSMTLASFCTSLIVRANGMSLG